MHARTGSAHGYDVVDPGKLDPAYGTRHDFDFLLSALDERRMNLLLDIVPNHLAASEENAIWTEVLASGRAGERGGFFDIDWEATDGRVHLPVLGRPLADAIAKREIGLAVRDQKLVVTYFERCFPVAGAPTDDEAVAFEESFEALDDAAAQSLLSELLSRQHYRLAYWRSAADDVAYRRFFDIDDLVGVRLEDPVVYEEMHRFVLELARDERIGGLRVDHIDGLADPASYLERLSADLRQHSTAPVLLVEKILASDEQVEPEWKTEGTTGYEFATVAAGLFVDAGGAETIASELAWLTEDERCFAQRVKGAKYDVLETLFPAQLDRVARALAAALAVDRSAGDLTMRSIRRAAGGIMCELDVYRTYGGPGKPLNSAGSRRFSEAAARAEKDLDVEARRALGVIASLFLDRDRLASARDGDAVAVAVAGFQQLAGAVMAKGAEDTAGYTPGRLLAGVDVGGDPDRPSRSIAEFHDAMAERNRRTPFALSATSTHDSKRGEDVRSRLAVLSEMGSGWISLIEGFRGVNAAHRVGHRGHVVPDVHEEAYLYETIVGSWPLHGGATPAYVARIEQHMEKALREAKRNSSWTEPDVAYEARARRFVSRILDGKNVAFLSLLEEVTEAIGHAGATNSLGLALLRVAAPGVPDTYMGTERWAFSLVDPDNRRPVDFADAAAVLAALDSSGSMPSSLLATWADGRVKLAVLARALRLRRAHRGTFEEGDYVPLVVSGALAEHVVAFARVGRAHAAVAAVVRKSLTLAGPGRFPVGKGLWEGNLALPDSIGGELTDVLTGRRLRVSDGAVRLSGLFSELPVALLTTL
jgi:malto-oligosyltrehalose synthase